MIKLSNKYLTVSINEQGAELSSVCDNDGIEYIWQANPDVWGRHAPVLFPFVGRLKDDQFKVNEKTYPMGQHGFARDMKFNVINQVEDSVTLELKSNSETLEKYPFKFDLKITYELHDHQLKETYTVDNPDAQNDLLFSIGGHPGFNLNLGSNDINMSSTALNFAPKRELKQIPIQAPYLNPEKATSFNGHKTLSLSHELFKDDALVFELEDQPLTITSENNVNDHGISFTVENAPYLGIWSPYPAEAEFICIEPWWGVADTVSFDGDLSNKLGINKLAPNQQFNSSFDITFF